MPSKTPKTQNQWAGFQVRECNDYNEDTGICHHEETSVDRKGGLFGHYFPNNICKYFHRGRDGVAPRTFKQNISAGLINMDSVAEAILKQADKNIQEGKSYSGAAVREVHSILNDQQTHGAMESSDSFDTSYRQAGSRENYSKFLWQKMHETENTSSSRFEAARPGYHPPMKRGTRMHKESHLTQHSRRHTEQVASPLGEERMDTTFVADMTQSASYESPMITPVGAHGHPESPYNYYGNYGESVPMAIQIQRMGFNSDMYVQGSPMVPSKYNMRYRGASFDNAPRIPTTIEYSPNPGSVRSVSNSDQMYELSADHTLEEYRFHPVRVDNAESESPSSGFISGVHFLKPPSSYHASHYWSQLWTRACDEYNPQNDTCQHEKKLWKCSFPEKVCLHFHPGRNSEKRRAEVLSSKHKASRELVAQLLISDCIDSDFSLNAHKNPVYVYIHANQISKGTIVKNELPSTFTVRTVDLPFHWPLMEHSEMVHILPEIVFISSSPLFSESLLQPMMRTFGYDLLHCVKRRTSTNEMQYFIWTATRNAHYLKGLDSLFTFSPGKRPSVGIVVGDITICPAERFVQPSERLRFLLIDEVANFRVQFSMPKGFALSRKLSQIYFPREWNFRSLLDEHKGLFRHLLTRTKAPEASSIIRMSNHSIDYLTVDGTEYILYDRQLNEKELNVSKKSLLLYTPAYHTIDDVARVFHSIQEARVMHYDRQRSLNLNLLAFYMRLLKYIVHKRRINVNEVQVIIVGGRTVERSCEVNGIYKIFGANLSRPSHRVVTIRFKNETTEDGYPRYTIGESAVSLSEVKDMLLSGDIGEVMEMVCLTGPTLIDACVADLPTVSTLQDQTHLLEDSTRLVILMSSEESWMSDLTAVQRLRNGNLDNMLVLVKTRNPRDYFRANFENQNIILFDRSETAHARHCLRLFILSGIARHLIHMICHSNEKEDPLDS